MITVGSILIRGLRLVVVGSVRAVVESVLLPVVLWLITVGWTPVRGWRVVAVGSVRVVVGYVDSRRAVVDHPRVDADFRVASNCRVSG